MSGFRKLPELLGRASLRVETVSLDVTMDEAAVEPVRQVCRDVLGWTSSMEVRRERP